MINSFSEILYLQDGNEIVMVSMTMQLKKHISSFSITMVGRFLNHKPKLSRILCNLLIKPGGRQ